MVLCLFVLAFAPAVAGAQTDAPVQPVPVAPTPATPADPAPPEREPPDPTKVVSVGVAEPLELLQESGDAIKLSDEKLISRWAHAQDTALIHLSPTPNSRSVARLRFLTEDGVAEVYPVLDARMDSVGRKWLHIRVPMRPAGKTGWVLEDELSPLYVVRTQLVIDRSKLRAKLFKQGRKIWESPVGIGKASTPTPRGQFWIRELLKGLGDGTVYGPWAFGTSAYTSISDWPGVPVIGIHGTNQPALIPGRPSHGCVRVPNVKIRRLAVLMPIGTPVRIIG